MEKMLVTQALNELKILDSRINREIRQIRFVEAAKTSEKKVTPTKTKEDFIKEAEAAYTSITDLISRRERIKTAIVESNANTMVEICGETISVAKAIDLKSSISYKRVLLSQMEDQFMRATATMNTANVKMEQKIDDLVATAFGKEAKTTVKSDDYAAIANPYRAANEHSLVDPLNIEQKIKEMQDYIEEFESTVDSKLQVSNCITYIEF